MWKRASSAAWLVTMIVGVAAFADGKMFSSVTARVNIPDQSAVITFDGKSEELIIDTAFEGEGNEFAWVVPLPAVPKVEKRTRGLVPTLRMICRPRLVTGQMHPFLIGLGAASALFVWLGVAGVRKVWVVAAVLVLAVAAPFILPLVIHRTVWLGGRMQGEASASVTIHGRERVGAYDVATVSADGADVLLAWLGANGFRVDEAIRPVLDEYVAEKWVFVVYRFARDGAEPNPRAHPLSFKFPAEQPVYPLRLTGVGNGSLALDLYVFAEQEAAAPGMARDRVAYVHAADEFHYFDGEDPATDGEVPIFHKELAMVAAGFPVLTKLTATLTPELMRRDLELSWKTTTPYRRVLYTREAVRNRVLVVGAGTFLALSCLVLVYSALRPGAFHRLDNHAWRFGLAAGHIVVLIAFLVPLWRLLVVPDRDAPAPMIVVLLSVLGIVVLVLVAVRLLRVSRWVYISGALYAVGVLIAPVGACMWPESAEWGIPVLLLALLLIIAGRRAIPFAPAKPSTRLLWLLFLGATVLGLAAAGGTALALTKKTTSAVSSKAYDLYGGYGGLYHEMVKTERSRNWKAERRAMAEVVSLPPEKFRKELTAALARDARKPLINPYTGQPVREEDSPGNYVIEATDGLNRLYYHDANGARVEVFWSREGRHAFQEAKTKDGVTEHEGD